jgi:hypothetical protein
VKVVTTDHIIKTMNAITAEEKGSITASVDIPQPMGMLVESQLSTAPRELWLEQEKADDDVPQLVNQEPGEVESDQEDNDEEENIKELRRSTWE